MQKLSRTAFQIVRFVGYEGRQLQSVASSSGCAKVFAAQADGALLVFDGTTNTTNAIQGNTYQLQLHEQFLKGREKKPVQDVRVVESWNILVCIKGGYLSSFDIVSCRPLTEASETKGCTLFEVNESTRRVAVGSKRKLQILELTGVSFSLRCAIPLDHTPKCLVLLDNDVIVGMKGGFYLVNLQNTASIQLLHEMGSEPQNMVCLEVPAVNARGSGYLLVDGPTGVVMMPDPSSRSGRRREERIEWSAAPARVEAVVPFLVSMLSTGDKIEIHDIASLSCLQTISLRVSPVSISRCRSTVPQQANRFGAGMSSRPIDPVGNDILVVACNQGTTSELNFLRMVPLAEQVRCLVMENKFEEALALCELSNDEAITAEFRVPQIQVQYALTLVQKFDIDGALKQFSKADSDPIQVLGLFESFLSFKDPLLSRLSSRPLPVPVGFSVVNISAARVYSALAAYLVTKRQHISQLADEAECRKSGQSSSSLESKSSSNQSLSRSGQSRADAALDDDIILVATIIDTALVKCWLEHVPPKKNEVIELFKKTSNHCHDATCSICIGEKGNSLSEAMLWLHRSKGNHSRALSAMTEDRCVDTNGWTREQFLDWSAEYLRWLWMSQDPSLPRLVLMHPCTKALVEMNPQLGLQIFMGTRVFGQRSGSKKNPASSSSSVSDLAGPGGQGVAVLEVVNFLKSVHPRAGSFGSSRPSPDLHMLRLVREQQQPDSSSLSDDTNEPFGTDSLNFMSNLAGNSFNTGQVAQSYRLPFNAGRYLAITYFEFVVLSNEFSSSSSSSLDLQTAYAQFLLENLLPVGQGGFHASSNDLMVRDGNSDEEAVMKAIRHKLQFFLLASRRYSPEQLLHHLDSRTYLHEHSLLLSRQGKHADVLSIYVRELQDVNLAEAYCERVWKQQQQLETKMRESVPIASGRSNSATGPSVNLEDNIYTILAKVMLTKGRADGTVSDDQVQVAVRFAEKFADRINPEGLLELLPQSTPLSSVSRLIEMVIRKRQDELRHLHIHRELLRVNEVMGRIELSRQQARSVIVNEHSTCPVCMRPLDHRALLWYPNGIAVHYSCGSSDLNTCPVTGEKFGPSANQLGVVSNEQAKVASGSRNPFESNNPFG